MTATYDSNNAGRAYDTWRYAMGRDVIGAVSIPQSFEALCDELRQRAGSGNHVDLWLPAELSLGGAAIPVEPSGVAMAIIGDTALSLDLWPDGFTQGVGGRSYHFKAGNSAPLTASVAAQRADRKLLPS